MNAIAALLQRAREGKLPSNLAPLDTLTLPKFISWEKGFDAYVAGVPFSQNGGNDLAGRSRPLWRQGWLAAKRIDELVDEQKKATGAL